MEINNKYTGFEKMLQDKLGNYEYPYDPGDWASFEKKLPKGKGASMPNMSKFIFIAAVVILSSVAILYFAGVFKTEPSENTLSKSEKIIKNDNDGITDASINDYSTNTDINSDQNAPIENNESNDDASSESTQNNSQGEKEVSANSTTNNDVSSENKDENTATKNTNNTSNNNTKSITGELITSDVIAGCAPLKVKFSPLISDESISYLWAFGDGKTSSKASPSHVYSKAGNYTVTLTVKFSDSKTSKKVEYSQKINVKSTPVSAFSYSVDTETDSYSFTDDSKNAFLWTWSFGDKTSSSEKDPEHIYNQDGSYNVRLITMNTAGCTDTMTKSITVKLKELFYCPTGFTPNGDGMNDYFGPIGDHMNADGYQLKIFDQSGIQVFETDDLYETWDGRNHTTNTEAAQGLYFWKISMKDKNNLMKETSGYLTLMR